MALKLKNCLFAGSLLYAIVFALYGNVEITKLQGGGTPTESWYSAQEGTATTQHTLASERYSAQEYAKTKATGVSGSFQSGMVSQGY